VYAVTPPGKVFAFDARRSNLETTMSPINVLFLCTGNSARSILAEGLLNHLGQGRFHAFSGGSHPNGLVNRFALELLEREEMALPNARSKSWDEFAAPGAAPMNIIITVCDHAAGEVCPIWPGHPAGAHWGVPDPAAVEGSDAQKRQAFRAAFDTLRARVRGLVALPSATLTSSSIEQELRALGRLHA
jgi:arsenate reductase